MRFIAQCDGIRSIRGGIFTNGNHIVCVNVFGWACLVTYRNIVVSNNICSCICTQCNIMVSSYIRASHITKRTVARTCYILSCLITKNTVKATRRRQASIKTCCRIVTSFSLITRISTKIGILLTAPICKSQMTHCSIKITSTTRPSCYISCTSSNINIVYAC